MRANQRSFSAQCAQPPAKQELREKFGSKKAATLESRNKASVFHDFTPLNILEVTASPEYHFGLKDTWLTTPWHRCVPSGTREAQKVASLQCGTTRTPVALSEAANFTRTSATTETGGQSQR